LAGCCGACWASRARAAILRRWAARRACRRLLITLRSGFALSAFVGGCISVVTGGPPSVAIFVDAMSASGEACALIASGAAGAASLIGGKTCAVAAILVMTHRRLGALLLLGSALISYARVYVGDEYPGDIAGGVVVGVASALLVTAIGRGTVRRAWARLPSEWRRARESEG